MIASLQTLLRALRTATSPAERYRHARTLHGVRVTVAMLTSIVLTSGIDIPHGVWASVSMLVVIGGLQHQGNIRQKAFERAVGTMIGAVLGLAWVAQYALLQSVWITYALLSVTAGICGYYAVGKGGYIALLTAITMSIVAGHGDDSIEIGLWRTANVLIGIAIALAFSFAFPLHATYSWRHGVARNLRLSARLFKRAMTGRPLTADEQVSAFGDLSARLVSLRVLMPSVARESHEPLERLESIQRAHRSFISALEMLASAPLPDLASEQGTALRAHFAEAGNAVRRNLLDAARGLRSDSRSPGDRPNRNAATDAAFAEAEDADVLAESSGLPVALQGPYWLLTQIVRQSNQLHQMLSNTRL